MTLPMRTYDGSDVDLSHIYLRAGSGTVSLPALRFFDESGRQVCSGTGGSPISATLDTTWRSLAERWETASQSIDPRSSWESTVDRRKACGVLSDPVSGEIWVSLGEPSPAVPSLKISSGARLRIGAVPAETDGSTVTNGSQVAAVLVDLQREEDSAHGSGQKGLMVLGVRQDTPGALVDADGDYAPLSVTGMGRLRTAAGIEVGASAAGVLNAVNDVIEGSCQGMSSVHFQFTGVSGAGPSATVEVFRSGVWTQIQYGVRASGSITLVTATTFPNAGVIASFPCEGASLYRIRMSGGAGGPHQASAVATAALWSPWAQITAGAVSVSQQGGISHGGAVGTGIGLLGLEGRSSDGSPLGASGQGVRALGSLLGKIVALSGCLPGQSWSYAASAGGATSAGQVTVAAAGGAGVRHYLRSLQVCNQSGTAVTLSIRDGSAGTTLWRAKLDADNGAAGFSVSMDPPLRGSPNTPLIFETDAAAEVYVNGQGYSASE
jgi:hypothetical protein